MDKALIKKKCKITLLKTETINLKVQIGML